MKKRKPRQHTSKFFSVPHPPIPPLSSPRARPTTSTHAAARRARGHTSTYMRIGSPTPSISGMTHLRSNALASTILKIFCTLIDADVEQKMTDACIAFAKRFACRGGGCA